MRCDGLRRRCSMCRRRPQVRQRVLLGGLARKNCARYLSVNLPRLAVRLRKERQSKDRAPCLFQSKNGDKLVNERRFFDGRYRLVRRFPASKPAVRLVVSVGNGVGSDDSGTHQHSDRIFFPNSETEDCVQSTCRGKHRLPIPHRPRLSPDFPERPSARKKLKNAFCSARSSRHSLTSPVSPRVPKSSNAM